MTAMVVDTINIPSSMFECLFTQLSGTLQAPLTKPTTAARRSALLRTSRCANVPTDERVGGTPCSAWRTVASERVPKASTSITAVSSCCVGQLTSRVSSLFKLTADLDYPNCHLFRLEACVIRTIGPAEVCFFYDYFLCLLVLKCCDLYFGLATVYLDKNFLAMERNRFLRNFGKCSWITYTKIRSLRVYLE